MKANRERCIYCDSVLKRSKLSCPQCNEKIFTKENYIKNLPWLFILRTLIIASIILAIIMFSGWLFVFLISGNDALRFVVIFYIGLIVAMISALIIHKIFESGQFIISNKSIQFKMRNEKAIEFVWNEINKIEIIKERYRTRSGSETGSSIVTGYNLKFYLPEGERSLRLWCLYFTRDKSVEKVIELIKEFSKYFKKEIKESDDLEDIKYRRFDCPKKIK